MGSRIIAEMLETLRDLHKIGLLNASEPLESMSSIENRTKEIQVISANKSKKLKP